MKNRARIAALAAIATVMVTLGATETSSAAMCANGTWSNATGRGACSWNGGVSDWMDPSRPYSSKNSWGYGNDYGNSYGRGSRSYGSSRGYGSNSWGYSNGW